MTYRHMIGALAAAALAAVGGRADDRIEYNRDIRPILAENCYACHGPDKNARKADLRLDQREEAFRDRAAGAAIVPGDAEASALLERITTDAAEEGAMPPPKSGKRLTRAQVETLRRWIDQGAPWQGHWSYSPPKRP